MTRLLGPLVLPDPDPEPPVRHWLAEVELDSDRVHVLLRVGPYPAARPLIGRLTMDVPAWLELRDVLRTLPHLVVEQLGASTTAPAVFDQVDPTKVHRVRGRPCRECGATVRECDAKLERTPGEPCCKPCHLMDTHGLLS